MRVILFQRQFVGPLVEGVKNTTIRAGELPAFRKRFPIGCEVSFRYWSGAAYRSPQVEFARGVVQWLQTLYLDTREGTLVAEGYAIPPGDLDRFARQDGFENFEALRTWFVKNHGEGLFRGVRISFGKVVPVGEVETERRSG